MLEMGAAFIARWDQAVRTAAVLELVTESQNSVGWNGPVRRAESAPWVRTGHPEPSPMSESTARTLPELGSPGAITVPCPRPVPPSLLTHPHRFPTRCPLSCSQHTHTHTQHCSQSNPKCWPAAQEVLRNPEYPHQADGAADPKPSRVSALQESRWVIHLLILHSFALSVTWVEGFSPLLRPCAVHLRSDLCKTAHIGP